MIAQRLSSLPQIAIGAGFKVKADEINHAVFGFFKLWAQKLATKVTCNLHHSLRRIGTNGVEFLLIDDAHLHTILQRLFEKRACVVQRDRRH